MDWKECNSKRLVKETSVDDALIASLRDSAEKRLQTAGRLEIDEVTAASVVSLYYDCLRELLEALAIKNSYKIYNHNCYCAFLKEIISEEEIGNSFGRFRKIRNNINYYSKGLDSEDALKITEEILKTINKIKKRLERNT